MSVLKGVIEKVEIKSGTSKAGKKYDMTILTILGKKYSNFGKFEFDAGDEIQIVVEEKSGYLNFRDPVMIKPSDGTPLKVSEETVSTGNKSKVKVIQDTDAQKWEDNINAFNEKHNVFATQIDTVIRSDGTTWDVVHTAMLFYK